MLRQIVHNRGLCVTSTLALLVAVMTSPVRPLGPASRPDCVRLNFSVPPIHSPHLFLRSAALRAAPVKAVHTEKKESLSRDVSPAWCSLTPPSSTSLKTTSHPLEGLLTQASRPLRC